VFGVGFAGNYSTIFTFYCLLQLGTNTAQGPYQAFIPDLVPPGKRGLASGVKTLFEVGGGVALLYPVSLLMDRYHLVGHPQWLWLSLVILAGLLLGMMLITVMTVKETAKGASHQLPVVATLVQSFKIDLRANRYFVLFLASRLLVIMAFTTLQTFALYFLQDVIGVTQPARATAQFSIVAAVGMLALVYPAGRLSDRMGRRPIIIAAGLLGGLGVASLFFATSLIHVMLSGGLIGIAFGSFMSSSWALATDLVAKDEEAKYLGLTNITTAGGSALARLMGPLIDFFNASRAGLGYQVMLGACLTYLLTGTLLLWIWRPSGINHPRN
jgi:Na+/melibiose symporter-like transporter